VLAPLIERPRHHRIAAPAASRDELAARRARNAATMQQRLDDNASPMRFYNALRAVRDVLADRPDVYVVNESANALDIARNVIDMQLPGHRLDSGTWGSWGIGMGYAITAAVETGDPVVAIVGDSAFRFGGMDIETVCRYRLPVTVIVMNNGGVYRGDEVNLASSDPSRTELAPSAHHERLIEAFAGTGYHVTTPEELGEALRAALSSRAPVLIDCVRDPSTGTESGHIAHLNPKSTATAAAAAGGPG
jgi:oxalyl-CoA decarboxylase